MCTNINSYRELATGFIDRDANRSGITIVANYNGDSARYNLFIVQRDLTRLAYEGTWAALTTLFSQADADKIWASYTTHIKNCFDRDNWTPTAGTAGGYKYTCFPYAGSFAIFFDKA